MYTFTEASYENSIIELFENLGYLHIYGPDLGRNEDEIRVLLMEDQLQNSLEMINPGLPSAAIKEAIYKIKNYEAVSLIAKNEVFTDYLQNGVQVSYQENGDTKGALADVIRQSAYVPFQLSAVTAQAPASPRPSDGAQPGEPCRPRSSQVPVEARGCSCSTWHSCRLPS